MSNVIVFHDNGAEITIFFIISIFIDQSKICVLENLFSNNRNFNTWKINININIDENSIKSKRQWRKYFVIYI